MLRKKKAVVEVQFNWVFVLIVGGIILAFFATIVMKQKTTSEEKISITTLSRLDEILVGAGVSANTVEVIQMPEITLSYDCPGGGLYIGGAKKALSERVLFSPKKMTGRKLVTWTLDWNVPFKVANFLYLGGEDTKYVFVSNSPSPEFKKLFNDFPANFSKSDRILNVTPEGIVSIAPEGFKQYRFIFDDTINVPGSSGILAGADFLKKLSVTAVQVDLANSKLTFYGSDGSQFKNVNTANFFDTPEIYAAIFSDDFDNFICTMKNAVKKLNVVSKIYAAKEQVIIDSGSLSSSCAGLRGTGDMNTIAGSSTDYDNYNTKTDVIRNSANALKRNLETGRRFSCPPIY